MFKYTYRQTYYFYKATESSDSEFDAFLFDANAETFFLEAGEVLVDKLYEVVIVVGVGDEADDDADDIKVVVL